MSQIREGDVFRFRYSDKELAARFMPYHCFDGQLVAFARDDGMVLVDTYWLHDFKYRSDSRHFTEAEAKEQGELTFVCNLNDVEKVYGETDTKYFDPADVFNLSHQHGCYKYFAVRSGASRSQNKMAEVIGERIRKERAAIDSATCSIARLSRDLLLVEQGRLSEVYL